MRSVTILGATGSVGRNTLDLLQRNPDRFAVEAVTANRSAAELAECAKSCGARLAVVADPEVYEDLKAALSGSGIETAAGEAAIIEAAQRPTDFVMAAIVGAAGMAPTMAAADRGALIGLANKEALVCAGPLMTDLVGRSGATLLPVDSEHNAIFQVLDRDRRDQIDRLILTASGGPFRGMSLEEMRLVTPAQAVAHPNWSMGAKISVDSATMMNKGLELIEAHHLFRLPPERIDVVVHPQSIVHSLVAYSDGSTLAQLGMPDMRTPIAYCLAWPERMQAPVERLDLAAAGSLTFEAPDPLRFPALRLARQALVAGASGTIALNAANEIAVRAFLDGRIPFLAIAEIAERSLERFTGRSVGQLGDVFALDEESRARAEESVADLAA